MSKKKFNYDGPHISEIYDDLSWGEIAGVCVMAVVGAAIVALFYAIAVFFD